MRKYIQIGIIWLSHFLVSFIFPIYLTLGMDKGSYEKFGSIFTALTLPSKLIMRLGGDHLFFSANKSLNNFVSFIFACLDSLIYAILIYMLYTWIKSKWIDSHSGVEKT